MPSSGLFYAFPICSCSDGYIKTNEEFANRYFSQYFEAIDTTSDLISNDVEKPSVKKLSIHSEVFSTAWAMFKKDLFKTFSDALKTAWMRISLIHRLRSGIAYFTYNISSGEIRKAIGTLREGNFFYTPKSKKSINLLVIKYFDLEARGFRSCRVDRLIQVDSI